MGVLIVFFGMLDCLDEKYPLSTTIEDALARPLSAYRGTRQENYSNGFNIENRCRCGRLPAILRT
ncbi:hypothetical protein [Rhizobium sp. L58/93]|uniref:hypothetical protein n=1 Tax=Rhizobium sp. L58/93 TaxID=2820000 RepID=UPI001AD9D11B|nr:hypothetical protein [Rhizobium sp. L58/93]MBO9102349.1 hypothetical protein [Rhizobium sp. L58/93]